VVFAMQENHSWPTALDLVVEAASIHHGGRHARPS
jgi:hypothetical protein